MFTNTDLSRTHEAAIRILSSSKLLYTRICSIKLMSIIPELTMIPPGPITPISAIKLKSILCTQKDKATPVRPRGMVVIIIKGFKYHLNIKGKSAKIPIRESTGAFASDATDSSVSSASPQETIVTSGNLGLE